MTDPKPRLAFAPGSIVATRGALELANHRQLAELLRGVAEGIYWNCVSLLLRCRGRLRGATLIDAEDFDRVVQHTWHLSRQRRDDRWYVAHNASDDLPFARLHRFTTNAPGGRMIDHRNGNGLDNRKTNLRLATNAENQRNKGARADNRSGYKGVSPARGVWRAQIKVDQRSFTLGYFECPVAAAKAYDVAAAEKHGQFAWLNFPQAVTPQAISA